MHTMGITVTTLKLCMVTSEIGQCSAFLSNQQSKLPKAKEGDLQIRHNFKKISSYYITKVENRCDKCVADMGYFYVTD